MTQGQAATPAPQAQQPPAAATPANNQQPANQQPPSDPPSGNPGGQVTISTDEYAQLQRDRARLKSAQRRSGGNSRKQTRTADPTANPDDVVNEDLEAERQKNRDLEQRLFERDVKDGVRDLLAKPEYARLPESTKKLILKNPASLSSAQSPEEAIMDVEDFLREEASAIPPANTQQPAPAQQAQAPQAPAQAAPQAPQQAGHDTPPNPQAGSPAAAPAEQLEDLTNLTGPARSKAALRNAMKKSRGVQG